MGSSQSYEGDQSWESASHQQAIKAGSQQVLVRHPKPDPSLSLGGNQSRSQESDQSRKQASHQQVIKARSEPGQSRSQEGDQSGVLAGHREMIKARNKSVKILAMGSGRFQVLLHFLQNQNITMFQVRKVLGFVSFFTKSKYYYVLGQKGFRFCFIFYNIKILLCQQWLSFLHTHI